MVYTVHECLLLLTSAIKIMASFKTKNYSAKQLFSSYNPLPLNVWL